MNQAGRRSRLFVFGIIAATAVLPFLFSSVFQSGAAGTDAPCFSPSLASFEEHYGPALSAEKLQIETACEKHDGPLTLKELAGLRAPL